MEGFNDLILRLREVHEREVEGWQVKVQELSNKKGWWVDSLKTNMFRQCHKTFSDTKRMEELFTRNQQMKEQQRLLTENIKTLENRLRAGLCDRCTVTQEVAKKRQQEYEASQIQSLQHISLLAGEMNNLKKDNKRLRDELRSLRAALDRNHRDHSASEVKPRSSPDLSPSPVPVALVSASANSAGSQPAEGNGPVKAESDQRSEEAEQRQLRGISRSHFESYKPFPLSALTLSPRKTDHAVTRVVEKRVSSLEGLDQRPVVPPHSLLLKRSPPSGEVNPSRHVLHAPVPCRPQPIRGSPVTLPWSLPESCDWANAAGAGMVLQPSLKSNLPRYPNLIPTSQHANSRRQAYGHSWHKQAQLHVKEPMVVFRVKSPEERKESPITPQEKKEVPPYKVEKASTWHKEACEGPLDLSDRGKPKSGQTPRNDSPLSTQDPETGRKSPDKHAKALSPRAASSASPVTPSLSSCTPPGRQQEEESAGDHNHKLIKEQEQREEGNGKAEQSAEKKVPSLTISLRPVVVLETLNSTLQNQDSASSNGKSPPPAAGPGSGSDEVECALGQESSQGCKRKRSAVEPEADRHSDTESAQHERKIKITVRSEEKSPS